MAIQLLFLAIVKEVICNYETLTTVINIYKHWYRDCRLSSLLPAVSQMAQIELTSLTVQI